MQIAIIGSRGLPARYGGFESLCEDLALNWSQIGISTVISGFNSSSPSRKNGLEIDSPTNFHKAPMKKLPDNIVLVSGGFFPLRYLRNAICTYRASKSILKDQHIDAVLVLNAVNILSALKFERAGVPVLIHMDGHEQKRSGLPRVGRWVHSLARRQAISSNFPLVVDSFALTNEFIKSQFVSVIKYAPHPDLVDKSELADLVGAGDYFVAIARFVPENQIALIIKAFLATGSSSKLIILGKGTGTRGYEHKIESATSGDPRIITMPGIYDRGVVNALLKNAQAYIHGHSVGGTNPILVDARFHAKKIFCHENAYNRESSGGKEFFWRDESELMNLFARTNLLEVREESLNYLFETQESIANSFLSILKQIKINSGSAPEQ